MPHLKANISKLSETNNAMVVLSLKMHLCSGSYVPLWEIYPCTNIKQEIQYACTKMLENWCSQWWKIRNLFMFYGGELTEWLWFLYLAVCSGHKYTTTLSLHKAVYCWIWWRSTLCQARSQMPEILMSKGKCLSLRTLSSGKTDTQGDLWGWFSPRMQRELCCWMSTVSQAL